MERINEVFKDGIPICKGFILTEDYIEAEQLFRKCVDGIVMPVHLTELVDEWNYTLQSF